ncbi:MAG: DNA polymerase III subunit [Oscillospiraceae bacterium]|nr:DNA polymerase III subunit [Oscillospiraceae bacterium]
MAFDTLLGNEQLKANLTESLAKNRISHFYLISGPRGSGKHTLANLLATAILCTGREKPCGVCPHCRKMKSGNHPDFITVEDPEHKNVAVRIVRQIRDDMFIRPNEADRKIYLFPQELGIEGQNALLKILEEPPAYGVFLLLTDNPDKLLPTVRSRCTELKLHALSEEILQARLHEDFPQLSREDVSAVISRSGGFLGQARELLESGSEIPPQTEDFLKAIAAKDPLLLTLTLAPMQKWKRDALAEILTQWLELVENAILSRNGIRIISSQARELAQLRTAMELHAAAMTLKKAIDYTQSNVSPAAVCGWLEWELR